MGFIDDFTFFFLSKKQKPLKQTTMIQAAELRIGNYYMNEGRVDQITNGWQISFIRQVISPIPITEEWLTKFGFKQDGYNNILELSDYKLSFNTYDGSLFLEEADNGFVSIPASVKHIHQFQNLFYALFGKELTIKQ